MSKHIQIHIFQLLNAPKLQVNTLIKLSVLTHTHTTHTQSCYHFITKKRNQKVCQYHIPMAAVLLNTTVSSNRLPAVKVNAFRTPCFVPPITTSSTRTVIYTINIYHLLILLHFLCLFIFIYYFYDCVEFVCLIGRQLTIRATETDANEGMIVILG